MLLVGQVLRINLPNYIHKQTVFAPEGSDPYYYYYSNQGDNLDNTMTRTLAAPLSTAKVLTFRTQYDIEEGWDYAYVEYTTNGTTWTPINGNLSTEDDPNAQNQGHGITGASGGWVNGTYTVPAGATGIRFRYWTDGAFALPGFAVDSISLGGEPADDASNTSAWTFDGFQQVQDGVIKVPAFRYFLVESRSYVRNDASLRGAYNFLFGNWLAKQPYADGVLVWLRDSGWGDNNVSLHPGHGQILPIDAHPQPTISPFEPASDHAARAEQQGRPPRPHLLLQPGQRVLRLKPEGVLECADPDLEHDDAGLGRADRHPQRLGRPHHLQGCACTDRTLPGGGAHAPPPWDT